MSSNKIELTKINKDINGNSRYVCHYSELLTDKDKKELPLLDSPIYKVNDHLGLRYKRAIKRANAIGGKKYNTKRFQNCIVFQSANVAQTEKDIKNILLK